MGENELTAKKLLTRIRVAGRVLALLGCVFLCPPAWADDAGFPAMDTPVPVNLIVSKNIRPYVAATDAMREALDEKLNANIDVYDLYRYKGNARQSLAVQLSEQSAPALFIAVGPEATAFLWEDIDPQAGQKLYSIVLNPEKISPLGDPACGISLNIPPRVQMEHIQESLPGIGRIGIFYDPAVNSRFFAKAAQAAYKQKIRLVPAMVSSKKEIPEKLKAMIPVVDALWLIPDRTVISESIAQYIIKQSVLQGVPVIGYNQFFYESGAAVSFVFDYAALGRQTARMAVTALTQEQCLARVPEFKVWINQAVYEKFNMELPQITHPLEIGP